MANTTMLFTAALLLTTNSCANHLEFSGKVGVEQRYFQHTGLYPAQLSHSQTSAIIEPEFYWGSASGDDSVIFKPFYRLDSQDDRRSHFDIRELAYVHASNDWELRVGIRKEFWGVTEFQHLVDVINQTDAVEDIDGEDKLGQQMINLSLVNDWGIVDLFILPGFRERQFVGQNARLRAALPIDNDHITYQSKDQERHVDYAVRWAHSLGEFDLGAYWFKGTNRQPELIAVSSSDGLVLRQYYQQMDQLGVDVQVTTGDFLWKFESIYRHTDQQSYWASQAGFEYSYYGIFDSSIDLGLLLEHAWDSRGEGDLVTAGAAYQNDIFLGSRLAFNDAQDSTILLGLSGDLDHNASSILLEASRRIGENFKASIDLRVFSSHQPTDQIYSIRQDDHAQLSLDWYF